jgi:hypothetical protein
MRRFGQIDKNYWWITAHAEAEEKTALIPIALARKESDFSSRACARSFGIGIVAKSQAMKIFL